MKNYFVINLEVRVYVVGLSCKIQWASRITSVFFEAVLIVRLANFRRQVAP